MSKKSERIPPVVKRGVMLTIEENIHQIDARTCRYKNGVSDETIAKRHTVSIWTVQNIRRQYFGNLEIDMERTGISPVANAFRRITALEEAVMLLTSKVEQLEGRNRG